MTQTSTDYQIFLERKTQLGSTDGFAPLWTPDFLFDFQAHLVDWAIRKGRAAIFADCGLGKTPMQLVWAENVVRKTNGRVLILTPLAVSAQTVAEAEKFGIEARRSREGEIAGSGIYVTNYERLHYFDPVKFAGIVCDESSILKDYSAATCIQIIEFLRSVPYRLLATATPSPNDFIELGNSAEAMSIMRRVEMLCMYFIHDSGDTQRWRLKGHAQVPFWRWIASWARALRKPSDLGYSDNDFILPGMSVINHELSSIAMEGNLFPFLAMTLDEQRAERRKSIEARTDAVAEIANASREPFIAWCSLNAESERLTDAITNSIEVTGSQSIDEKEERVAAFTSGQVRAIVSKPSICGHGMNWQHCAAMSFYPTHSHEEFYQAVRRCHRFGQKAPVQVHMVFTEAESAVIGNLMRKELQSSELFSRIVANMKNFYEYQRSPYYAEKEVRVPAWL